MKITLPFLAAAFLSILTACGQNDNAMDNDSEYRDQTRNGQEFVGNHTKNVTPDWDNEAERPSDQLLNTPHHTSNNSPSMGQEVDKIRAVIKAETDYDTGMVWHNGNTIHVTVLAKGKIKTEQEREKEKRRIEDLILRAVPQYNIDVKVKK